MIFCKHKTTTCAKFIKLAQMHVLANISASLVSVKLPEICTIKNARHCFTMIVQHWTLTENNTACVHISVQYSLIDAHTPVARMHFVDCVSSII